MLATVVFSISEMPTFVVALIGAIFPSVASVLIHERSPLDVKINLSSATFAEYYGKHTQRNCKKTSKNTNNYSSNWSAYRSAWRSA